jgi:hypothetical protein
MAEGEGGLGIHALEDASAGFPRAVGGDQPRLEILGVLDQEEKERGRDHGVPFSLYSGGAEG